MRKSLWILLLLLAAGAGTWHMTRGTASTAPTTTLTETVSRSTFRKTVLATGVIEASSLVSVGAQVGGQIQALPVTLGQVLKAGDLVAQIDPEDQQTDLLRAEASLAQIRAQIAAQEASITEAQLLVERKRKLAERDLTTQQDLEATEAQFLVATANLDALNASLSQAELAVQSARIALERTRITAPSDGTVVAVVAREGQTINANQSSPTLIKIADLSQMIIKVDISEADVIHVRPGMTSRFSLSGAPDQRFSATLRDIEPAPASIATSDEVDTSSAIYYRAVLEVPNTEGLLRIGMTAEVIITLEEIENALTVPTAAIEKSRKGSRVRVKTLLGEESRAIETGAATASRTVVTQGLTEGDEVIIGQGSRAGAAPAAQGRSGGPRPPGGLF